jgi:hypothetical protein
MYMHPYAFPYGQFQPGTLGAADQIDAGACAMARIQGEADGQAQLDAASRFSAWFSSVNLPTTASLEALRGCYMQGYEEGQAKATGAFYKTGEGQKGIVAGVIGGLVLGVIGTMLLGRLRNPVESHAGMYGTLSDAAHVTGDDRYRGGLTKIWYAPENYPNDYLFGSEWLRNMGKLPTPETIPRTHKLIGSVSEKDPDAVYAMMQGEVWSPRGQARELIKRLGLEHTSMSIGDIVQRGKKFYMVDRFGFYELQ